MVLTGDAFLQHLHDCKMLPGHSLKSKKSAFSVFLWKRKGWVTPTSFVTLVYSPCSATHAKQMCGNILLSGKQGLSKAKAAGGYKPSSVTVVEVRGSLKLEVFSNETTAKPHYLSVQRILQPKQPLTANHPLSRYCQDTKPQAWGCLLWCKERLVGG